MKIDLMFISARAYTLPREKGKQKTIARSVILVYYTPIPPVK
jgi:hypothetical protein